MATSLGTRAVVVTRVHCIYFLFWSANDFENSHADRAVSCDCNCIRIEGEGRILILKPKSVVVVRSFNATGHPRHIEAAAIVMYMYLYSLAFMDHPCTLGAAVCHQAPPCPLYTQPRARRVWTRRTNGLKIVSTRTGFEPTISRLKVKRANH